jgi:hypothetical protein
MRVAMARAFAAIAFLSLQAFLVLTSACGGGESTPTASPTSAPATAVASTATPGGASTSIDIKDFDTARFTTTQRSTTGENISELSGEGVIDNRKQALSLTYAGEAGGQVIAIGRTIYTLAAGGTQWISIEEPVDGQVGFGRPYWPQFWLDAAQIEDLGGQSLQGAETTGYRVLFDLEEVAKRLGVEVAQAEAEVWVDNDSRYALQLTFLLELNLGGGTSRIEITSDFSDFGTDVEIEAPEVASPTPAATSP